MKSVIRYQEALSFRTPCRYDYMPRLCSAAPGKWKLHFFQWDRFIGSLFFGIWSDYSERKTASSNNECSSMEFISTYLAFTLGTRQLVPMRPDAAFRPNSAFEVNTHCITTWTINGKSGWHLDHHFVQSHHSPTHFRHFQLDDDFQPFNTFFSWSCCCRGSWDSASWFSWNVGITLLAVIPGTEVQYWNLITWHQCAVITQLEHIGIHLLNVIGIVTDDASQRGLPEMR